MNTKKFILVTLSTLFLAQAEVTAFDRPEDGDSNSLPPVGYDPKPISTNSRIGKKLYLQENCSSCHQISGNGGTTGPPLDGIGGHRGREFLLDRLQNPQKQSFEYSELFGGKAGLMPHTGLSKRQASRIADYLLTLPEPKEGFVISAHDKENSKQDQSKEIDSNLDSDVKSGAALFLERGCAACHTTFDEKPRFGPSLKGISQRKSREEIQKLLSGQFKNRLMKQQAKFLSEQEICKLTDFLLKIPPTAKERN